jgi:diguanylate cyclase (GGDEF)-like protein
MMFEYLRDLLYSPQKAALDVDALPEEMQELGNGLLYFGQCVNEVRDYTTALSRGDLDSAPAARGNDLASGLKSLHASLRHITWQVQQVSKGDYSQNVSFMGEFADAINDMVHQLDERQRKLLAEIDENKRKSEALAQSNSLFEMITQTISQWIVMIDRNSGEWLFKNHDIALVLRSLENEQDFIDWIDNQVQQGLGDRSRRQREVVFSDSNGQSQYFDIGYYDLTWHDHEAIAFVFTDITADKERFNSLENIAYHDPLTNTFNRHYGMNILNEWMAAGETFIVCFVDMDNLKFVNDRYGHAEGDVYILNVTAILKRFSHNAVVCRLGGDEFMLLCKDWTLEQGEERLEALRDELMNQIGAATVYKQSLSYGCMAVDNTNTLPASELLTMADEKMYIYKRAHKADRRSSDIPPY